MSEIKTINENELLSLEYDGKSTFVLVNGKRVLRCKRVLIPVSTVDTLEFETTYVIEELFNSYNQDGYRNQINNNFDYDSLIPLKLRCKIEPEKDFLNLYRDIQAWCRKKYDSLLINPKLAFPLLRELTKEGDPAAKIAFKKEIYKMWSDDSYFSIKSLILNNSLLVLSEEEIIQALENCKKFQSQKSYFKIVSEIVSEWRRYVLNVSDSNKEIVEAIRLARFITLLFQNPIVLEYYRTYARAFTCTNNYLKRIFFNYELLLGELCEIYDKKGLYDNLIEHCRFSLRQNYRLNFPWLYLCTAYEKKGEFRYAKAAHNIYWQSERKSAKKVPRKRYFLKFKKFR